MAQQHVQIDCGELKMCAIDPEVIAIFFLKHYSQQFPTKAIKWNPKMHVIKWKESRKRKKGDKEKTGKLENKQQAYGLDHNQVNSHSKRNLTKDSN